MKLEETTEEQIFKSRFPEYCAGERCLSPYFDLFQIGFEEGEKQNEELKTRNAELELKIKHLTEHLEPQAMTSLFEQVEEEVRQEQRIEELERENAELKTKKIPQLERKIASIRGAHSVDCRKLNARIEQVERLKKENAELKDDNKIMSNNYSKMEQKFYDNLTEAKEIICLGLRAVETNGKCNKLFVEQAEQFLKETKE